MNRRQFLTYAGVGVLAGCLDGQSAPSGAETDGSLQATSTPVLVAEARVSESTLETVDEPRPGVVATGTVENVGDLMLYNTQITAKFYNDSTELINARRGDAAYLEPGERWEFWLRYNDPEITEVNVQVARTVPAEATTSPKNITLKESDLEIPTANVAAPRVTGRIVNERETEANIRIGAKVYASNGNVVGTGRDRVNYVEPDEVWRFDTPLTVQNPEWKSRIDDFELIVMAA